MAGIFSLIEKHGEMAKAISNTMRNIFGITGMFVWSFAATSNNMVSNLIGQKKQKPCIAGSSEDNVLEPGCLYCNKCFAQYFSLYIF